MNITKLTKKSDNRFISDFIKNEKDLLLTINSIALNCKDFSFYIGWFLYAINDYIEENYDIQERFIYFFLNNYTLDIMFFPYIMNKEFREKAEKYIIKCKQKYGEEYIYG